MNTGSMLFMTLIYTLIIAGFVFVLLFFLPEFRLTEGKNNGK